MLTFINKLYDKRIPKCSCVIAAAGTSQRMGGVDKLFSLIQNKTVLSYSIKAMDQAELIDEIIIATQESLLGKVAEICEALHVNKPVKIIIGGKSRTESVFKAALETNKNSQFIAVHDGARPLITSDEIDNLVRHVNKTNAVAPAIPVIDTIKIADMNGLVLNTPDRSMLYAVQTPQIFQRNILIAALQKTLNENEIVTDDCAAVENLGKKVYLIQGNPENIKITLPTDLLIAESILQKREHNK